MRASTQLRGRVASRRRVSSRSIFTPVSFRPQVFFACLVLAVATAVPYSRVADFPFLPNGDDVIYVGDAHIQAGLNWATFKFAFTATGIGYPTPLTFLSHALDFEIYGPNAGAHHVTNVLFHVANVVILFLLLLWSTGAMGRSLLVAALFALHPLNVEGVAWIAERKNVLSTFFFLLALGAYGLYAARPNLKRYLALTTLFVLALAAKPMVITLPFVLLLLDFWPLRRRASFGHLVLEKLPLLAFSLASATSSIFGQSEIIHEATKVSLAARLENAVYSYGLYIRDTFWPAALATAYRYREIALARVLLAAIFLLTTTALVWRERHDRPYLITGWLWYLGTLVPVSGVVWMGNYSRADRYAYIPLIGIFVMMVWGAAELSSKIDLRVRLATAVTILAALSFLSWRQIGYWQSDYELWAHAVKVEPNNLWAQALLASAVWDQEMADPAATQAKNQAWRDYYRDQLKRAPLDPLTEILLVQNLVGSGDEADAIVEYRRVIVPTPEPYLRAVLRVTPDPYERALTYAEIAEIARMAGDYATMQSSWFRVRESCRQADPDRMAEIVAQWSAFLENNPSAWGYTLLGIFFEESGHFAEARAAFDKAHQLDPSLHDLGKAKPE